ncbi:MAG: DUF5110 domain-containing protein [Bacteroidetes bacterium]|nr:DUF5110 domain-containing protein [Bacteroidota bacterium]MBT4400847.1 DUF5110 domain-containing protein [Bacteroidota bacterium]MBT7466200.1 DUF5110 domain-containing protein [Bacteroidota bacterium]
MNSKQASNIKGFKSFISFFLTLLVCITFSNLQANQGAQDNYKTIKAKKINATTVEVSFSNDQKLLVDFYGDNIFRLFQDNSGEGIRAPQAEPEAHILVTNPRNKLANITVSDTENELHISTEKIKIVFDHSTSLFSVINRQTNSVVLQEAALPVFEEDQVTLSFKEYRNEYFYGGGVQNGRFSHKGKSIAIENLSTWTDGGVASPSPYYWSSKGYGFMWYTFKKGKYDFGSEIMGSVKLRHNTDYLDVFFMINESPAALLDDFYQLTGNPILLPKFGFYEGHLNAYNRDFWKEDSAGILFEDGKQYKESQRDTAGIKESLNGELNNYQFSARAVIDRYKKADMPFGWILPNDGYGAGYGQTETLDGNIQNLKEFGDYAREKGVEIGLWTQSDLYPIDSVSALLQRDIVKEVHDAGVRVLKTDVAWVGPGYSFGLNGVGYASGIMAKHGENARSFIISIDGWAGTQRYASIWSGDQVGGFWEYIRFHIPTYIGAGLSGQPNITSDMDGIFGGKNSIVNIRDFQWKTFTPMQLNMDGWGSNPKYPDALGEPAISINRSYLKLKSELMPYAYSIAKEAVDGLPMIRAMFLESKNSYTQGKATQYQFMYGPYFLVAPIYKETASDMDGNDIRNGVYLPEGTWIDYFSGDAYEGNRVINHVESPIWKLPVFVKSGAIIPMINPNNNVSEINERLRIYEIYPGEKSSFIEYNDDGVSNAYKSGKAVTTLIESEVKKGNIARVIVHASKGDFEGFVKEKSTEFRINVTEEPKKIIAKVGNRKLKLAEVLSLVEFESRENVYFYSPAPDLNKFATKGSEFENILIVKNPQLLVKVNAMDITMNLISLEIKGYRFAPEDMDCSSTGELSAPKNAGVLEANAEAFSLEPTWDEVQNSDYYEIAFNDMLYSTIKGTSFVFEDLSPETEYDYKLRAVNKSGASDWLTFTAKTKIDPLTFAIKDIKAEATAKHQGGQQVSKLFDFDESRMWHTKWGQKATPFEMTIDLNSTNQLDKLEYLPRSGGGNGTLLKGKVYYSNDKQEWTEAGAFIWEKNDKVKIFNFDTHPTVRYLKISVSESVGNFGSGRQLYIFKIPG